MKSGSKPCSFNKGKQFLQRVFTCGDKIPITLYSFSKSIPLLDTFLMKAKISFKSPRIYQHCCGSDRLSLVIHLSFEPPYQLTCSFALFCSGTQCCLRAAHYWLQLMTRYFYLISELSFRAIGSGLQPFKVLLVHCQAQLYSCSSRHQIY